MLAHMKLSSGQPRLLLWLLWIVLGVVSVAGLTLLGVAIGSDAKSSNLVRTASESKKPATTPSILVRLTHKGFEPSEISILREPFFLVFENRSGINNLDLQFDRLNGGRLKEVRVAREAPEWVEFLDLSPGDYQLSDRNHSELIFRLKVISR